MQGVDSAPSKTGSTVLPPLPDWQRHALFLDFDGTLVPIADRPEDVELAASTRSLLERLVLATKGAVAVLSGRSLDSLSNHLRGLDLALSGSHGLEIHLARAAAPVIETGQDEALDAVYAGLGLLAQSHGLLLERKPGAVALHFRNRPDRAEACRAAVADIAGKHGLRVMHGNMVSEAAPTGIDKGTALRRFLAEPAFKGRLPVMIGDDTTDEDAFRAAQDLGGFGLRIGAGDSVADYRVARMDDALGWLAMSLSDGPPAR